MRKIHLLGIFLILADFALLLVCAFFEIGMGPEESMMFDQAGATVKFVWPQYIEWYVCLPVILIGLAALVCIFWPPRIRKVTDG